MSRLGVFSSIKKFRRGSINIIYGLHHQSTFCWFDYGNFFLLVVVQLDREIRAGGWYIVDSLVNSSMVFDWPHSVLRVCLCVRVYVCVCVCVCVCLFGFQIAPLS